MKRRPPNIRNLREEIILDTKFWPDWLIGWPVNQCKSQLFVGLAIELTLHASHKNNNCQVNLRILSNSCYQCFYVLTFILMEIYLFCVHPTIAVSYEFTPESRTVQSWSVGFQIGSRGRLDVRIGNSTPKWFCICCCVNPLSSQIGLKAYILVGNGKNEAACLLRQN